VPLSGASPLPHYFLILLTIWDANLYIEIFQMMGL
jgi:hypothetical protein